MTALPRFSIVICNYNYARLVGDAIRSALEQDYPADRFEVIVVDDGSTDHPHAVYALFAQDPRFHAITQDNRGQSAAFDAGVRQSTGDYVCLLDSDDVFLPCKLRRLASHIAALKEEPGKLFLCHDLVIESVQASGSVRIEQTWFDVVTISRLPDRLTLENAPGHFAFSVPCGLVFARDLVASCLEAMPLWEFRIGTDGVLCPAALLKAGHAHYLREPLGVYRLHDANDFASVVDGKFTPRHDTRVREPRRLQFLERWLDLQDKTPDERAGALRYLRVREHHARRLSASHRLAQPTVAVIVIGESDAQTDVSIAESLQSHAAVQWWRAGADGETELMRMAHAWIAHPAEYMVFMRSGDRLDRTFVERHLHLRHHGALVTASCSDIRLISADGALVHADVFANSGAWKQPIQPVPPLATSLRDWVAPPMSGCMFRRNVLLDRLFAHAASAAPALQAAGFWLLMQFAHHTGGVLRLRETLSSCRLHEGAAASYGHLSAASHADGTLIAPPLAQALHWFGSFHEQEQALLRQWLPEAWHRRFHEWLAAHQAQRPPTIGP